MLDGLRVGVSVVSPFTSTPSRERALPCAPPAPVDSAALGEQPARSGVSLGLMVLATVTCAAPLAASAGEAAPPPSAVSASLAAPRHETTEDEKPGDGWNVRIGTSNDSTSKSIGKVLLAPSDHRPNSSLATDDGWTAGGFVEATHTTGDRQSVTSLQTDMLTERGSWTHPPGYGARRTDLLELVHQENRRFDLDGDGRRQVVYGAGLGLQAVGPLGGLGVQEWFHGLRYFGGRLGPQEGLQTHYTTDHVEFSPMVTGGVAVTQALDSDQHYAVRAAASAGLPLGPGLATARAELGVVARPYSWVTAEAGVRLDAAHSQTAALDFLHPDGVRPGWYMRLEGGSASHIHPFFELERGGVKDQTNWMIGVSIPLGKGSGGDRPWMDNSRR